MLSRPHDQHRTVGMMHNRMRDATHQSTPDSAKPPTAHCDQPGIYLLGYGYHLNVGVSQPQVGLLHLSATLLDLLHLFFQ